MIWILCCGSQEANVKVLAPLENCPILKRKTDQKMLRLIAWMAAVTGMNAPFMLQDFILNIQKQWMTDLCMQ